VQAAIDGYRGVYHRARIRATRWIHPPYALTKDVTAQGDRIINIRFAVYYGISPAIAPCPLGAIVP
jgi:hypothetical protein